MSTTIDGFQILRAIGEYPNLFHTLRADVNKAANAPLKKLLKTKNVELKELRAIRQSVGDDFDLALDHLGANELLSVAKELDKNNPQISTASPEWLGSRLRDLCASKVEPVEKPTAVPKPPRVASGKAKLPKTKSRPYLYAKTV